MAMGKGESRGVNCMEILIKKGFFWRWNNYGADDPSAQPYERDYAIRAHNSRGM